MELGTDRGLALRKVHPVPGLRRSGLRSARWCVTPLPVCGTPTESKRPLKAALALGELAPGGLCGAADIENLRQRKRVSGRG